MKKILFSLLITTFFVSSSLGARNFIEGTDYYVDFEEKTPDMAAVLHINFISIMPTPEEAEPLLKEHLNSYAKTILEAEKEREKEQLKDSSKKKSSKKSKKPEEITDPEELRAYFAQEDENEKKYKNIIGSVWYNIDGEPKNMLKVQYSENSSAFVYLGKTGKTVPFPEYIKFLKKENELKKDKEKERARQIKQLYLDMHDDDESDE